MAAAVIDRQDLENKKETSHLPVGFLQIPVPHPLSLSLQKHDMYDKSF